MDFDLIERELVKAVRGERSQASINRQLGFRGNQVQRWEAGTRRVAWSDFVNLCTVCGINIGAHIRRFVTGSREDVDTKALVAGIMGGATLADIARDTGISRYALMRWQQGKSEPSLGEILKLVHHCQYVLFEMLQGIVDVRQIPSAYEEYRQRQRRKQIYYRRPVVAAVLCALKLDDYRALPAHQDGFVATKIGITPEEERQVLSELVEIGKVRLESGKYLPLEEQLELTDSKDYRTFVAYWLDRALDYTLNLPEPYPVLGFGMEIQPVSDAALRRIRDEYRTFYSRVRALLTQDQGPRDRIMVFNSLFFNLERRLQQDDAAKPAARPKRGLPRLNAGTDPTIPYSP